MVLVLDWLFRPQASARSIPENREITAILLWIILLNALSEKNFIGMAGKYIVRANFSFHSMQIQNVVENLSGMSAGDRNSKKSDDFFSCSHLPDSKNSQI